MDKKQATENDSPSNPQIFIISTTNPMGEQSEAYYLRPIQGQHNTESKVIVQRPVWTNVITVIPPPPDNLCLAIFACLCCFWPLGLVAVFKANQSQTAHAKGDIDTARKRGAVSREFSIISILIGVVVGFLFATIVITKHFYSRLFIL